jgi:hypothetical protein
MQEKIEALFLMLSYQHDSSSLDQRSGWLNTSTPHLELASRVRSMTRRSALGSMMRRRRRTL